MDGPALFCHHRFSSGVFKFCQFINKDQTNAAVSRSIAMFGDNHLSFIASLP